MPRRDEQGIDWPDPQPDPEHEPVDLHRGPLDDDEDGRWLERDDPRRVEAELRRGRPFDQDDEIGYEGKR
jgi:hypothetical protein